MNDIPRFHLDAPDDLDDALARCRLGDTLQAFAPEPAERFTYSQAMDAAFVDEAAAWAGLQVHPDGPCTMVVIRRTPKLPVGSWVVNLNHMCGPGWPMVGRVSRMGAGGWAWLRPYDIQGTPSDVLEPLDSRWLARICKPAFPLDSLVRNSNGICQPVGQLGLEPWSIKGEAFMRVIGPGGMVAENIDARKTMAASLAEDHLMCRAFDLRPQELMERIGIADQPSATSEDS